MLRPALSLGPRVPRSCRTWRAAKSGLVSLLFLHADALEREGEIEILVSSADRSPFADFGLTTVGSAIYIRIGPRGGDSGHSIFRSMQRVSHPTEYVSALVRMVGGMLIAATSADRPQAMHLFLPVARKE